MKRTLFFISLVFLSVPLVAGKEPARPRILGIARVQILVSDLPAARSFYTKILNQTHDCNWCEHVPGQTFLVNPTQAISLSTAPSPGPTSLIEEIVFATDDVPKLRRYLAAHNIAVSKPNKPTDDYLSVADPEGHRIGFVHSPALSPEVLAAEAGNRFPFRLIHAGFVVHDSAVEDRFFKDILGFRLYWHGGMKDDKDDWVNMQVPDGTDWIEYMLNVPFDADHRTLGGKNHIALGVPDIKVAKEQLVKNGWTGGEEPKIGRGGKWQLNLYDPDDTRVELMEFTPTQKPCCSEYTGPHPKP
jgi:catechol 2,3-dioxygenase-like lactoylglutathione lyase family enzyme